MRYIVMVKKAGQRNKILANVKTEAEAKKVDHVPKGYTKAIYPVRSR